jgi:hypothetical protein
VIVCVKNNEWERICKEVVVIYFEVLCQQLPGGTEENHKNPGRIAHLQAEI